MSDIDLDAIEARHALLRDTDLSASSDSPWWRALDSALDVRDLLAEVRQQRLAFESIKRDRDGWRAESLARGAEVRRMRERYEPTPEQMAAVEARLRVLFISGDDDPLDLAMAAIARVEALCDRHESGALRWADPLPVPEWIPLVRAAVRGES